MIKKTSVLRTRLLVISVYLLLFSALALEK